MHVCDGRLAEVACGIERLREGLTYVIRAGSEIPPGWERLVAAMLLVAVVVVVVVVVLCSLATAWGGCVDNGEWAWWCRGCAQEGAGMSLLGCCPVREEQRGWLLRARGDKETRC